MEKKLNESFLKSFLAANCPIPGHDTTLSYQIIIIQISNLKSVCCNKLRAIALVQSTAMLWLHLTIAMPCTLDVAVVLLDSFKISQTVLVE